MGRATDCVWLHGIGVGKPDLAIWVLHANPTGRKGLSFKPVAIPNLDSDWTEDKTLKPKPIPFGVFH